VLKNTGKTISDLSKVGTVHADETVSEVMHHSKNWCNNATTDAKFSHDGKGLKCPVRVEDTSSLIALADRNVAVFRQPRQEHS